MRTPQAQRCVTAVRTVVRWSDVVIRQSSNCTPPKYSSLTCIPLENGSSGQSVLLSCQNQTSKVGPLENHAHSDGCAAFYFILTLWTLFFSHTSISDTFEDDTRETKFHNFFGRPSVMLFPFAIARLDNCAAHGANYEERSVFLNSLSRLWKIKLFGARSLDRIAQNYNIPCIPSVAKIF